jgi:hypothetical protein
MDEFSRKYLNDLEIRVSRAESEAYQSLVDLYKAQVAIRQAAGVQADAIAKYKDAIGRMKTFSEVPGLTEQAKERLGEASKYAEDAVATLSRLWREESEALLETAHEILDDGNKPPVGPKTGP